MAEYRIEYSIQRAEEDDGDFTEIGFGSSGGWGSLSEACHMLSSGIVNYVWETTAEHPDPDYIRKLDDANGDEE